MIACFLSNISAKYYKNPSMLSLVIAKNVGDVFFETQCTLIKPVLITGCQLFSRIGLVWLLHFRLVICYFLIFLVL